MDKCTGQDSSRISRPDEQLVCWNVGGVKDPRQLEAARSREDGWGWGSGGDGRLLEKEGPGEVSALRGSDGSSTGS